MTEVSFDRVWQAVVVQPAVRGVANDSTAAQTMRSNAEKVAEHIEHLCHSVEPRPRLVVYPELCLTGTFRSTAGVSMAVVVGSLEDEVWRPIKEACRRNGCYFASTLQEKLHQLPQYFFHTAFILGPSGVVLRSPKAQSFSAPEVTCLRDVRETYEAVFGAGSVLPVVETELGRLACLIDTELLVPEAARLVATKGAEVVIHPTRGPLADEAGWPVLPIRQANAFFNGCYLLSSAAGRTTTRPEGDDWRYLGACSSAIGPDGRIDGIGELSTGVIAASVDPDRLRSARESQGHQTTPAWNLYR